jgi:hypothetical protein
MNHSQNQWPPRKRNYNHEVSVNQTTSPDVINMVGNDDSFEIPRSHSPKEKTGNFGLKQSMSESESQ